jgi:hypothetical protein
VQSGIEGNRPVDTRSGMPDDLIERTRTWTLAENPDYSQYRSIRLPDTLPLNKVICTFIPLFIDCQLLYRWISVAAFRWLTSPVSASNSGGYIEPYIVETGVALQWWENSIAPFTLGWLWWQSSMGACCMSTQRVTWSGLLQAIQLSLQKDCLLQ